MSGLKWKESRRKTSRENETSNEKKGENETMRTERKSTKRMDQEDPSVLLTHILIPGQTVL